MGHYLSEMLYPEERITGKMREPIKLIVGRETLDWNRGQMPDEAEGTRVLALEKPVKISKILADAGIVEKPRWNVVDTAYYNARPDLYDGWAYLEDL